MDFDALFNKEPFHMLHQQATLYATQIHNSYILHRSKWTLARFEFDLLRTLRCARRAPKFSSMPLRSPRWSIPWVARPPSLRAVLAQQKLMAA